MPTWMSVLLGLVAGLAVIAGAIYLAVRPYLKADHKPWMPDATGERTISSGYDE